MRDSPDLYPLCLAARLLGGAGAGVSPDSEKEKPGFMFGAVIVIHGQVIARAHNLCEQLRDFTAHAEMQAFTSASEYLGGKFLDKCTLYVTLEPCPMCAGAAFWTRIGRVVYGAKDEKRGYSKFNSSLTMLHPKTTCHGGLLADEAAALLTNFFHAKRSS